MDINEFFGKLGDNHEIVKVSKEVDPKSELAAVASKIQKTSNLAILFERVKGSQFPVMTNLFGSYKRVGIFLGCREGDVVRALVDKLNQTHLVPASNRGLRESIKVTELGHQLPIVKHHSKDGGPYITGGIILAKDPETGIHNLSYHRMQWTGGGELRFCNTPGQHLSIYLEKAEKENKNLEAVVLLGASPAVMLAAAFRVPYDWNELQVAGTLQGSPLELTLCETIDLEIPADTSIAIEGDILHHMQKPEGPYGDWKGTYIPIKDNSVFQAKTITFVPDASYYTILSFSPEDVVLVGMTVAISMYQNVKKVVPSILDAVCWPFLSYGVIQIEKKAKGQGKKAALAALGANMEWLKFCIVVDRDIDIYNPQDVMWAVATRTYAERDIITIPGVPAISRDPHRMHWGRVIFDATIPFNSETEFERMRTPNEEKIRLEDYL